MLQTEAALLAEQVLPQRPQFFGSFESGCSQPSVRSALQLPKPEAHWN
jgi:hypothetical protein